MDEMQEIIQDFIVETNELIEALDQDLVVLEKCDSDEERLELLNSIFRAAHTIKGASGFLGFNQLVDICHKMENLLNVLRHGEMEVTASTMDVILEAVDIIKILIGKLESNDQEEYPLAEIIGKIDDVLASKGAEPTAAPKVEEMVASESEVEEEKEPAKAEPSVEVPVQEKQAKEVRVDKTIRIDTDRLDNVMNLVGELVLERNRLFSIVKSMEERFSEEDEYAHLINTSGRMNLITTDLQMAVMRTRMQPVKKVFSKFPRMVRDLARSSGKEIELVMVGEETELDKSVIEEIGDPMVHLIRNSVDHGIAGPDEREKEGKLPEGTIKLSAYHEGDQIVIEIADDGRGIDHEKVMAKAIEKKVIGKAEADRLTKKEALNLIFAPGFSTAEKVTDISGRGVGMDVVKTNITNLNGIVDVDTELGKGSIFTLKLPLTVAIIDALMVGTGEEIFAIPLSSVIETIRVSIDEIQTIKEREVISLRDGVLSLVRLSDEFDIESSKEMDRVYVVVIGLAEKRVGVIVENLLGQEEVVIKPLGDYLADTEGVSGATVRGDGRVVLILDINTMIQKQIDSNMSSLSLSD